MTETTTPQIELAPATPLPTASDGTNGAPPGSNPTQDTSNPPPVGEAPKAEAPAAPAEPAASPPAPDYSTVKFPENFSVDETSLAEVQGIAAKANIPPETFQELVDYHAKQMQAQADQSGAAYKTMIEGWNAEIERDPELGGANMQKVKTVCGRAIDEFSNGKGQELRQAFDMTGAGSNPLIAGFIYRMASALSEGAPIVPKGAAAKAQTLGQLWYPESPTS